MNDKAAPVAGGQTARAQASGASYRQELRRSIGFLGNLAITLSFLTPTASVFVAASVLITLHGTGAFLSLVIAAAAGLMIALCFAELGAFSRSPEGTTRSFCAWSGAASVSSLLSSSPSSSS